MSGGALLSSTASSVRLALLLRTDRHTMERHAPEIVETVQTIPRSVSGAAKATMALKRPLITRRPRLFPTPLPGTGRGGVSLRIVLSGGRQGRTWSTALRARRFLTGGIPLDVGCARSAMSAPSSVCITPCRASRIDPQAGDDRRCGGAPDHRGSAHRRAADPAAGGGGRHDLRLPVYRRRPPDRAS